MKLRNSIIFLLLFVLCGCSATYKLEFKDKTFKDSITIENNSLDYFKNNKFYAIMDGASNFVEYNKKIFDNSVNFKSNYNFDKFSKATVLKTCFDAYNIVEEDDYYILSTSTGIKCAIEEDRILLDDLTIKIKTNHVVKDTNADKKHNYEYVWHFNKDNYDSASISMKLYKDKYVFNYDNEFVIMISIIGGIILTILISVFIMLKKAKNANKI